MRGKFEFDEGRVFFCGLEEVFELSLDLSDGVGVFVLAEVVFGFWFYDVLFVEFGVVKGFVVEVGSVLLSS